MASSTTPLSAVSFATWNVRGLTSKSKGSSLAADCKRYNIDLVCLQETKTTERDEMLLQGGYALTLVEQKAGRHYGMGFVVSPRLLNGNVKATYHVSDRVCWIDLVNCKKDLERLRAMAADKELWKVTIKRPD